MPSFRTAVVTGLLEEREGLQRVALDSGRRAYALTSLIGPVAAGDRVVVNTTAVDLGLGTGGWDVVHWNLAREEWSQPGPGHVMKLRYTSLQADTGSAEEASTYEEPLSLAGLPVVVCTLHSQVACVAAAFAHAAPGRQLAYVMTDGGALPVAISDLVAGLLGAGLLYTTITAGQAFGGRHEAVNVGSALAVATAVAGADAVVVAPGPGVVGTGTRLGTSALEGASVVDLAGAAGARPIVALRYSEADPRPRHRGMSHHSLTVLDHAHEAATVPVPRGAPRPAAPGHDVVELDAPDAAALLAERGLAVATMGRDIEAEPLFAAYAAAAGAAAAWVSSPA
jgi:hypothetical protein